MNSVTQRSVCLHVLICHHETIMDRSWGRNWGKVTERKKPTGAGYQGWRQKTMCHPEGTALGALKRATHIVNISQI